MRDTRFTAQVKKTVISIGSAVLAAVTLAGCSTAGEPHYDDRQRCSDHGAYHRSDCMERQAYRRDREQMINQEKALINAEQARENLRMLREIRRRRGE